MRRHYPNIKFTQHPEKHPEKKHDLEAKERLKGSLNVF